MIQDFIRSLDSDIFDKEKKIYLNFVKKEIRLIYIHNNKVSYHKDTNRQIILILNLYQLR